MEKIRPLDPPAGLSRLFFRLPIYLYWLHLGWLLGGRFLLVNHIGRKSGQLRQVVIEVVEHDPAADTYTVAAGFGRKSDWYLNLLKTPDVTIQVGRRTLAVTAVPLTPDVGGETMVRYARRHETAARNLARFMGYQVDGTEADYRALGRELPFMQFRPRRS
ncbi:MAG: nitroreductase family deazaflavin-dependent oxidoreductase [Caldilineaceae bacterium]|nr:nitroreductase family deazaflavin-dependent oxidoreductase [Caldilineaceae bacterium]